jgi:AraC-like DNA-binding protein
MSNLSTAGLPLWRKRSFWNEVANEHVAKLDIEFLDERRFHGTISHVSAGPVTLISVYCTAAHIRHARPPKDLDAEPGYIIVAPLHREFELRVGAEKSCMVGTGDICLLDLAQPHEAVHAEGVRLLCVEIPRLTLEERAPGIHLQAGRLLARDSITARTLSSLLQTLGRELAAGCARELPHRLGGGLLELIAAAYQTQTDATVPREARTGARTFRQYIDSRLAEPELKPAAVARHFGISERYLRMVLQADGESFSAYVLRRRLVRSAQKLGDPRYADMSIMEIALDSGFHSATHFADVFKSRYGRCPRAYRREPERQSELEAASA